MKKFIMSKPVIAATGLLSSVAAFAEGGAGAHEVTADLVTGYITKGQTQVLSVLTAGAAIVGAFFVWSLIKRALNRSK